MEDAATAEISRAQVWQRIRHGAKLENGRKIDRALCRAMLDEELAKQDDTAWSGTRPNFSASLSRATPFPNF